MSHQYRAWRDYLGQLIEETMPATESYTLLHTSSMVGLFSCIFVKSPLRSRVRNLNVAEIKRGLGGLHGNKVCMKDLRSYNIAKSQRVRS